MLCVSQMEELWAFLPEQISDGRPINSFPLDVCSKHIFTMINHVVLPALPLPNTPSSRLAGTATAFLFSFLSQHRSLLFLFLPGSAFPLVTWRSIPVCNPKDVSVLGIHVDDEGCAQDKFFLPRDLDGSCLLQIGQRNPFMLSPRCSVWGICSWMAHHAHCFLFFWGVDFFDDALE